MSVALELSRDEALVLAGWLFQREAQSGAEDRLTAEEVVLAGIHAGLENALVEVFDPDFKALVAAAKARLLQA